LHLLLPFSFSFLFPPFFLFPLKVPRAARRKKEMRTYVDYLVERRCRGHLPFLFPPPPPPPSLPVMKKGSAILLPCSPPSLFFSPPFRTKRKVCMGGIKRRLPLRTPNQQATPLQLHLSFPPFPPPFPPLPRSRRDKAKREWEKKGRERIYIMGNNNQVLLVREILPPPSPLLVGVPLVWCFGAVCVGVFSFFFSFFSSFSSFFLACLPGSVYVCRDALVILKLPARSPRSLFFLLPLFSSSPPPPIVSP